jgi:acyl carrier protein
MDELEPRILALLADYVPEDELATLKPTDDIIGNLLDSLALAELMSFVEEEIGRPLRPTEQTRAVFHSIGAIVQFVRGAARA